MGEFLVLHYFFIHMIEDDSLGFIKCSISFCIGITWIICIAFNWMESELLSSVPLRATEDPSFHQIGGSTVFWGRISNVYAML